MSGNYDPYDPSVPQRPGESLADTQPELLNNFFQLFQKFAINHVSLDAGATAGNHTIIELVEQENPIQTDVSEISIYTKEDAKTTDQVFIRYQGNGQEFQYTCYQIYSLTPANGQTPFFTFLPGKILVYFGSFTSLQAGNILKLSPAVGVNLITVSLCPNKTAATGKPSVGKLAIVDQTNRIGGIVINPTSPSTQTIPPCFYVIMVNL